MLRAGRDRRTTALTVACWSVAILAALSGAAAARSGATSGSGERGVGLSAYPAAVAPAITIHFPHPAWVNVTSARPATAPPEATGVASAYDPAANETVEFGGCLAVGPCPDNQTWLFQDGRWSNDTQHGDAPSSRDYAAMDYDANLHAILLFGGFDGSAYVNDTWMYANGTWTNVTYYSAASPPAGAGAGMAFDPEPEENGSVLFGGCVPASLLGLDCSDQTWVWQGDAGWVQLNTSIAPPARGYTQMAYDTASGYVVMFGGNYGFLGLLADTWELYSGQWWNVTPTASPPELADGALVDDPGASAVLLFGGINDSFEMVNETWLFTAGVWTEQSPTASPPARDDFALALDGTGTVPIVQGGQNATHDYNDTWAYEFAPVATVGPNVTTAEVGESVELVGTVGDGTPPYVATFGFGDGSQAVVTSSGASPYLYANHTYLGPGSYPTTVSLTDAVGATATATGASVTVTAGPTVSARAVPSAGDAGSPVAFNASFGTVAPTPLSYAWSFGDGTTGTGKNPSHTYTDAGTYTVRLTGTDGDHATATTSLSVVVAPAPSVEAAASAGSPAKAEPITFYANVTGGEGPYAYAWHFGDGATSTLPYPQHAYNASGTYTAEVWVNDSAGGSAHAEVKVSVASTSSGVLPSLSGAPTWLWAALGACGAAAVVGSALIVRAHRRPKG